MSSSIGWLEKTTMFRRHSAIFCDAPVATPRWAMSKNSISIECWILSDGTVHATPKTL